MIKRNDKLIEEATKRMQDKIPEELIIHIAKRLSKHC